jgi:hypothetical protein
VVRLPLQWPPKEGATQSVKGSHELGAVAVTVKP